MSNLGQLTATEHSDKSHGAEKTWLLNRFAVEYSALADMPEFLLPTKKKTILLRTIESAVYNIC